MVKTINSTLRSNSDFEHRGLIVELIGLAGVGKSTLTRNLQTNIPRIVQEYPPSIWNLFWSPFYLKNILSLVPMFTGFSLQTIKGFKRRELAFMALLNGWHELLRKKALDEDKIIVIDQGAISCMAYLQVKVPLYFQNIYSQNWWLKIREQWAQTIDLIVWLSAPNSTLINRIKTRNQNHGLQNTSVQNAETTLKLYYSAYECIINSLTQSNQDICLLKIDSEKNSPDDIVWIVTSEINSLKPGIF